MFVQLAVLVSVVLATHHVKRSPRATSFSPFLVTQQVLIFLDITKDTDRLVGVEDDDNRCEYTVYYSFV